MRKGHKCNAPFCDEWIPDAMLMCGEHWRLVPADTRRRVNRAYRAWARAMGSDDEVKLQSTLSELLNARAAARDAIALEAAR